MRVKQGKMWICLSNRALQQLDKFKEEINEAVLFIKPGEYELTKQMKISLRVDNHTPTICFIKPGYNPMTLNLSDMEWSKVVSAIPSKREGDDAHNMGKRPRDNG